MAEEADEEVEKVEEDSNIAVEKPKNKVPAIIVSILKIILLVLLVILVSSITSIIIFNITSSNSPNNTLLPQSDIWRTEKEDYSWFTLDELKGATNDVIRNTFVIQVNIAYPLDDSGIQNEIIKKKVPITDILLSWFASQKSDFLRNIDNRDTIRQRVKDQLSQIMISPESIKDIRFTNYQILNT